MQSLRAIAFASLPAPFPLLFQRGRSPVAAPRLVLLAAAGAAVPVRAGAQAARYFLTPSPIIFAVSP